MNGWIDNGWVCIWVGGWVHRWRDRWMDWWTDGQMSRWREMELRKMKAAIQEASFSFAKIQRNSVKLSWVRSSKKGMEGEKEKQWKEAWGETSWAVWVVRILLPAADHSQPAPSSPWNRSRYLCKSRHSQAVLYWILWLRSILSLAHTLLVLRRPVPSLSAIPDTSTVTHWGCRTQQGTAPTLP